MFGGDVAENSADGEDDEAFAVDAIHLEFAVVEVGRAAAPIPRHPDVHVAKPGATVSESKGNFLEESDFSN